MDDKHIFMYAGIRRVSVIDLLHAIITSSEDAKKLVDYARTNDTNFLDFDDVESLGDAFIKELINIYPNVILIEAEHLIPSKYKEEVNILKPRKGYNNQKVYKV